MAFLAVSFAVTACNEPVNPDDGEDEENPVTGDLPKFDFPFIEEYPVEVGNLFAEGSDVGVTIQVTKVEDNNFVFELRPGAMVQSFKLDVYPLSNLYNYFLNFKNSGNLETGDPVAVNECIREFLFTEGSGGYAFSILDFENPEDFLQIEYDWMNTPYAAASAIAIPDCGYLIAVVASADTDISSSNQEELTLCYVHTTSQPLVGDPQVEIEVNTGYTAFGVMHHLNADAAAVYYFGGLASEVDEYVDTFGDQLYRDFMRTLYSAPVYADDEMGLSYSKNYGIEADASVKSATTAVAIDVNMTPQEGYARQDFSLKEIPGDLVVGSPKVTIIPERVAAAYFEFIAEMPKEIGTIFWSIYTSEEKEALENGSAIDKMREIVRLFNEGYGGYNPNFVWNEDAPDGEKATGAAGKLLFDCGGQPGSTYYIGYVGRDGYMQPSELLWSEPVTLDQRNLTSPDNCKVKDLKLWLDNPTRTSFTQNITYDPNTVSMVYVQYIPYMINVSKDKEVEEWKPWREYMNMSEESSWEEWVDLIFNVTGQKAELNQLININQWPVVPSGSDPWTWTGMEPGVEYTVFLCAEDFDGNISRMHFDKIVTREVQVGPDPTVNLSLKTGADGWEVVFAMDHDVEYFKYCMTDNAADLNIPGINAGHLNNIAESGIEYETWRDAIYEWVAELGMDTKYESVSLPQQSDAVHVAAALGVGKDADGNPCYKMSHLIIKDGKARTLEEIFGK